MSKLMLLIVLLLGSSVVFAQETTAEEEPVRSYTVEVIVFAYNQNVSTGTEVFVADTPPPDSVEELQEIAPLRPVMKRFEIARMDAEDFALGDIYARMQRLDVYKPLMHFGWTQPTYPKEATAPRPLHTFARPPAGLDGELTLYLSRFLHLALDLKMEAPASSAAPSTSSRDVYNGDISNRFAESKLYYRIQEDRIFRSGELRYFDHPKFGVLAKITRHEDVPEDEQEMLGEPVALLDSRSQ